MPANQVKLYENVVFYFFITSEVQQIKQLESYLNKKKDGDMLLFVFVEMQELENNKAMLVNSYNTIAK